MLFRTNFTDLTIITKKSFETFKKKLLKN